LYRRMTTLELLNLFFISEYEKRSCRLSALWCLLINLDCCPKACSLFFLAVTCILEKEKEEEDSLGCYIFFLSIVALKLLPQHSQRAMVSSVLFPTLSGFPAIFQVFFG
jgi:hypothetical protein